MNKVITSFASGENFTSLLEISLPTFYKYSIKHNYDFYIPSYENLIDICSIYGWNCNRPISWLKIPLIKNLLHKYDSALWIDADVVIKNFDEDINQNIANYCQAFVVHETSEGYIPNCGVWILTKNSIEMLDLIWSMDKYVNHCWWEQKAMMDVICWDQFQKVQTKLNYYGKNSLCLPYEWNIHKNDKRFTSDHIYDGKFLHATMWPDRLNTMKEWVC